MSAVFTALGFIDISQNDPPRLRRGVPLPVLTTDANDDEIVSTTTTAADTRNVEELQARLRAAGGVIKTNANSSDYIVAMNNRLRFSVIRAADGGYEIRESQYFWLLIGAAVVVGILLIAK